MRVLVLWVGAEYRLMFGGRSTARIGSRLPDLVAPTLRRWDALLCCHWYARETWPDVERYLRFVEDVPVEEFVSKADSESAVAEARAREDGWADLLREAARLGMVPTADPSDYADLHLAPGAPMEVVQAAYRALAKANHPDHGGSTERMQAINRAFETLTKVGR